MEISFCLIVKNEEKTLAKCLESFSSIAQEIIVVDTGSEDETKEMAKSFGAKIFDFKWVNDFAKARNFAIKKATQPWIMMVDADDFMAKKNLKKLKKELDILKNEVDAISLPYIYQGSEKDKKNTAYLPRIWRQSARLEWKYPIHEYLDISQVPTKKIKKIDLPIIHGKEDQNFSTSFKRNVVILKEYLKEHPTDLRCLYYMVHDSYQIADYESVIHWAQKYMEANPDESIKLCRTLVRKGRSHIKRSELMQAQESFLLANAANALLIEPYLALGDLYKIQKRYQEAIQMYRCAEVCELPVQTNVFYNHAMYNYYPLRRMTYTLSAIGKNEEAIEYGERALIYCPEDQELIAHVTKLKQKLIQ